MLPNKGESAKRERRTREAQPKRVSGQLGLQIGEIDPPYIPYLHPNFTTCPKRPQTNYKILNYSSNPFTHPKCVDMNEPVYNHCPK